MSPVSASEQQLLDCCHCQHYARRVAALGPFESIGELRAASRSVWWNEVSVSGWLEAFAAHPRIGDVEVMKQKFGKFAEMSMGEQSVAAGSGDDQVFQDLLNWNRKYEEKFGHIFIVFASGKTAHQMLEILQSRYLNAPHVELTNAAVEQMKITELRIGKTWGPGVEPMAEVVERRTGTVLGQLVAQPAVGGDKLVSPITTHVLDTSVGRPAKGLVITLFKKMNDTIGSKQVWAEVSRKSTNLDGRVPDLMPPSKFVQPGQYRLTFQTGKYQQEMGKEHPDIYTLPPFYPTVSIDFEIAPRQVYEHFHVPLLYNPFGYSTYRGS